MIRRNGCLLEVMEGNCTDILTSIQHSDLQIQTCITSPPYYGLRDYGCDNQIGLEETPEEYISKLVNVFRLIRNVMTEDGTLWVNIGDSYAGSGKGRSTNGTASTVEDFQASNKGSRKGVLRKANVNNCKPKDLIGIPWMLAFALRADGWYLRQDIIWAKPNPMPESVNDRCTRSHEYLFLLSKSKNYYFNAEAIRTERKGTFKTGRNRDNGKYKTSDSAYTNHQGLANPYVSANKRSVWTVTPNPFKGAHFATFPPELIEPCLLAGSRPGDLILDPFGGSGTTGAVALQHSRNALLFELNSEYITLIPKRVNSILERNK